MRSIIFSIGFFYCLLPLVAQQDSLLWSIELPTLELSTKRLWNAASSQQVWDSSALQNRQVFALADLLSQEGGGFVRSYGLGSLATATFRGAGSSQVKVLWDGLPLENPMLGLLDLSQLNPVYFNAVHLSAGGNSGGYGSGAIAGVIDLKSKGKDASNNFNISLDAGALGLASLNGHCYFVSQNKRWAFRTTISALQAENNFRYFDPRSEEWRRQTHARQKQYGLQQAVFYQPNTRELLTFRFWGQQYRKQIPASSAQRRANSSQADDFMRTAFHYRRKGKKMDLQIRSGWFQEKIDFENPVQGINAESQFWKGLLEATTSWEIDGELHLNTGISNELIQADAPAYGQHQTQIRNAPFLSLGLRRVGWYGQVSVRQDWVDGQLRASSPSIQLGWLPVKSLTVATKLSRDFRLPSLNDQYWAPGGNPSLKAEKGWSQELSVEYQNKAAWQMSLTGFHRLIKNWIQWAPDPELSIWAARNLTSVRAYGAEWRLRTKQPLGQLTFSTELGANYVRSLNLVAVSLPRLNANEQLAYTPEWTANGRLSLASKRWQLAYAQQYVGQRRNNSRETMKAYWPARLTTQYHWPIGEGQLSLGLRIENVWNLNYRVLEDFRMPGRYVQGRIAYQWHKKS